MDNLEKKGEKNAAQMLRERVVACETCELLATKELKTMNTSSIKKLLAQVEEVFQYFPPSINLKLAQQWFLNEILPPALESINSGDQLKMQSGFKMLVDGLALKPPQDDATDPEEEGFKIFNPKAPSFNGLFQSFVFAINDELQKIEEVMTAADFSIDNAKPMDEAPLTEALKSLMSFGEDWWFRKHGLKGFDCTVWLSKS